MMKLVFRSLTIGEVSDAFFSDQTWYGEFVADPSLAAHPVGKRVLEFKDFCEDWNKREIDNSDAPPDAAEFDRFHDLTESNEWFLKNEEDAAVYHIIAPVFFSEGEFSSRPWEFMHEDD